MNTWISRFSRRFLQIINSKSIAFAILDIIMFGKNILNYIRFNELAKHVTHSIPEQRQTQTLSHILNSFWNFSFNLPSPLFDPVLHLYFLFPFLFQKTTPPHLLYSLQLVLDTIILLLYIPRMDVNTNVNTLPKQ